MSEPSRDVYLMPVERRRRVQISRTRSGIPVGWCKHCNEAYSIEVEYGRIEWIVSLATPVCDHET